MTNIGVILGSTRPGRRGEQVARWVVDHAQRRRDVEFELVDLLDHPLPHMDEPLPPMAGKYQNAHTQDWAATIARFDGFVFVTPEYNHSTSDPHRFVVPLGVQKVDGILEHVVSYGTVGGTRAAEHLRLIAGELQMADVRTNVALSAFTDFDNFTELNPGPHQVQALDTLLNEVIAWSEALAPLRQIAHAA